MKDFTSIRRTVKNILISSLVYAACFLAILYIKQAIPFGENSLVYWDGYQCSVPALYKFWDVLHGEGSLYFSWSLFGLNLAGSTLSISPVNVLLLALIPRNMIYAGYWIMALVRCILMGLSFQYAVKTFTHADLYLRLLAGVFYAVSGFAIQYLIFPLWIDAAILFPFYAAHLYKLAKHQKNSFILYQTLVLILSLQQAFQFVIFTLFAYGFVLLIEYPSKDERKAAVLRLFMSTILSVLISAVVIIPAAISTLTSARIGESSESMLSQIFNTQMAKPTMYLKEKILLMAGLVIPIVVILILLIRKMMKKEHLSKSEKIFLFLSICVSLQIPVEALDMFWQGGSLVGFPCRGGYIIYFSVLMLFVLLTDAWRKTMKIRPAIGYTRRSKVFQCVVLLVVMVMNVYLNSSQLMTINGEAIDSDYREGVKMFYADSTALSDLQKDEQDLFSRYKNSDVSLNHNFSLIADVSTNSNFLHVLPENIISGNADLGYDQTYTRLASSGGTLFTDQLIHYTYDITGSDSDDQVKTYIGKVGGKILYRINDSWDFGTLMKTIPEQMTGFEAQNALSQAIDPEIKIVDIYEVSDGNCSLNLEKESLVYLYSESETSFEIQVNNEIKSVSSFDDLNNTLYPSTFRTGILELGQYQQGEKVEVSIVGNSDSPVYVGVLDLEKLKALKAKSCISQYEVTDQTLSFVVTKEATAGNYLFVPIYHDNGLICTVNGKETEIIDSYGFSIIEIPDETSTVSFSYVSPGFYPGVILTTLGVILLLFYCFKKEEMEKLIPEGMRTVVYHLYDILCFKGILVLFAGCTLLGLCSIAMRIL